MFALPNITLEEPIEVDGMALASVTDDRNKQLAQTHEGFANYLQSFALNSGTGSSQALLFADPTRRNFIGQWMRYPALGMR